MPEKIVIEMQDVRKRFGKKQVLKGITGSIAEGSVVGILGRNGEGKTTLFKILLDILAPDTGHVSVLGRSPDGSARIREVVGYIPEKPSFHDFMTMGEALRLREGFYPGWDRARAEQMARELELDLKTKVKGASKGTLAKAAWICATAHNPRVLLMDEPTSGLDLVIRDAVLKHFVREMAQEGKTIVVTSHHMEELFGVLREVWILADGRIQGRHLLEDLRNTAVRVSGRLKPGVAPPPSVLEEQRLGETVQWMVLDKQALYTIRSENMLENMQVEPLPLESAFRALLGRQPAPA